MDYKEINDYELLYMISDSDNSDTFEVLLDKYKPFVNQQLQKNKSIARKCGIDLDDLEQEVYLVLIYAIRNYNDNKDSCFYTYLKVLIERRISNFWREVFSARQLTLTSALSLSTPIGDYLTIEDVVKDNDSLIENIALEKDLLDEIYDFCYELSFDKACIFEMFINGYSREIIASSLCVPYKRVAYLLDIMKKKLKICLLKKGLFMI